MKRIDEWFVPEKIYDAHFHTFTYQGLESRAKRAGFESLEKMIEARGQRMGRHTELPPKSIKDLVDKWVGEMDKYGVTKGMTLTDWNDPSFLEVAMKDYPDRFIPYMMVNPKEEGAYQIFEDAYSKYGIKGIKLYPPLHYYHAYEDLVTPFYQFCDEHKMLVTYHMGISVGAVADLRFMNPADVSPIARDYKNVKFLFAHFATGYLKELLFLMYHVNNVYAETSSSNRWMEFLPYEITLDQVFKKVINASGADHLIFGTDSTDFPRGWRQPIYLNQLAVCNQIEMTQEEVNGVFFNNLEKILP